MNEVDGVLVLGAGDPVGRWVVAELERTGVPVLIADGPAFRPPVRAFLDLCDPRDVAGVLRCHVGWTVRRAVLLLDPQVAEAVAALLDADQAERCVWVVEGAAPVGSWGSRLVRRAPLDETFEDCRGLPQALGLPGRADPFEVAREVLVALGHSSPGGGHPAVA